LSQINPQYLLIYKLKQSVKNFPELLKKFRYSIDTTTVWLKTRNWW